MSSTATAPAKTGTGSAPTPRPSAGSVKDTSLAKWETPTDRKGLEELGDLVRGQVMKSLPAFMANEATAQRLIRCLITECQSNLQLLECTPLSLFACCIRAGQLGLEIGGPLGQAYIIPFKNKNNNNKKEGQLIPGYRGLISLAHRSGMIRRITPVIVRDGDQYAVTKGLKQDLVHIPKRGNNAPATDYYIVVELLTGGIEFEEFTVSQAIDHRNRFALSKSYGPWYDILIPDGKPPQPGPGFDAMALKTLIRRISKRLPLSVEMNAALAVEEGAETGKLQSLPIVRGDDNLPNLLGAGVMNPSEPIDAPEPKDEAKELAERLETAKTTGKDATDAGGVDFLSDAIDGYKAAGGQLEEFCDSFGTTPAQVRALQGKARGEWADRLTKETNVLNATGNAGAKASDGTLFKGKETGDLGAVKK